MNDGFVKVAAITSDVTLNDVDSNVASIVSKAKEAAKKGAKVIAFQELCLTGYSLQDMFEQEVVVEKAKRALLEIASALTDADALVVVSLPYAYRGKLYDAAAALCRGRILGVVLKTYLPNYNEFYDVRYFTPSFDCDETDSLGDQTFPIGPKILFACQEVENLVVGIEICEDLWTPLPPSTHHALNGATLIVNPSASNEMVGKENYRRQLVSMTSARLVCAYLYAGAGEGETTQDVVYSAPLLIAENGVVLAEANAFENKALYADVDVDLLAFRRRRMNTFSLEHDPSYLIIPFSLKDSFDGRLERRFPPSPYLDASSPEREKNLKTIFECQVQGLKKRILSSKAKALVVGVSGGLDSALALLVCRRAFEELKRKREDVIAISMPCFATTERTESNAQALAEALGVSFRQIDLTKTVSSHLKDIGHPSDLFDATYENAQARARTYVLMDVANFEQGIVVGTGDLSEIALGWATYNGDQMSMYNVNSSLPKTVIKAVVRQVAEKAKRKNPLLSKTLRDILSTPISPELVPSADGRSIGQMTEDIIGPYALHDFFLYHFLRSGYPPLKILRIASLAFRGTYSKEEVKKWLKVFYTRFFQSQFKRSAAPDGVKVGSVSLSQRGDLRIPSDLTATDFLDGLD